MTEEEKVAEEQKEEKKPEYRIIEEYRPEGAQNRLNELAAEGYELQAVTPAGEDDMGRLWIFWTLRLRRELRTPANVPLLVTVAATINGLSRRLELLENWRRDLVEIAGTWQPMNFGNEG